MGEACLRSGLHAGAFIANPTLSQTHSSQLWYALKTRVGGEQAAMTALRHRHFEPYCPLQKERRRYSDRIKIVEAPVFPGYVFCQFDIQQKLPIISCFGVDYIVGFSDGPTAVPQEEIENIRRMIEAGGTAVRSLTRGERVRVTHGPLEGVQGIFVRDSAGDRLVVTIQLLNQGASLLLNQDQVCPAGSTNE